MRKTLVYDLPTRIFHWCFVGLFIGAFSIAKTVDDESIVFSYHMIAGLLMGFIVGLRIIWGVVGPRYARFSSFELRPPPLLDYFKSLFGPHNRSWSGRNPASSWSGLIMLAFAAGLAVTGFLMTSGQKETYEDLHELLANGFLITVILHVAGVAHHGIRYRDGMGMSMIDGKKQTGSPEEAIKSSKPITAVLFILLLGLFSNYLFINYNLRENSLSIFGAQLKLGSSENLNRIRR